MAPSVVQCSSTLWRRFATFPTFLLLPLPSVLSFVIVMARQEIEVQENRKKKRGWRFCQSEVGVRQTCQSHWGRRTQYNHGNVFALCYFRFTQIFIYLQQSFQRKLWFEVQNFGWIKLFWMLFYQELCFGLRRWLLVLWWLAIFCWRDIPKEIGPLDTFGTLPDQLYWVTFTP